MLLKGLPVLFSLSFPLSATVCFSHNESFFVIVTATISFFFSNDRLRKPKALGTRKNFLSPVFIFIPANDIEFRFIFRHPDITAGFPKKRNVKKETRNRLYVSEEIPIKVLRFVLFWITCQVYPGSFLAKDYLRPRKY